MSNHSSKWIMLLLTNLILYTTQVTHNETRNTNVTDYASNKVYSDPISSKKIVTSDKVQNKTGESYNITISNYTTEKERVKNQLTNDSKKATLTHDARLILNLNKDQEDVQRSLAKSRRKNFINENFGVSVESDRDYSIERPMQREIDDAAEIGLNSMKELLEVKEPLWYQLGLALEKDDPSSHAANFGKPNRQALLLSQFGYAALEASRKLTKSFPGDVKNEEFRKAFQSRLLQEDCPLRGRPRCSPASKLYRTPDGTCNNLAHPWWGASLLPMERFLSPKYDDGIQEVRRSKSGRHLPSARDVSVRIHRDRNLELPTVTLMFMQWGQFIDHDLVSTAKSRGFNGSIPRCCDRGGRNTLPLELMHPSCLPIDVSDDDWFLSRFGVRCLEFTRSAPATRLDCDLGWREQINQVSSFLDGSNIYGSDLETSDAIRTFRNGKLQYGRPLGNGPLNPPDPPGGELCRSGALSTECFEGGDGRFGEQTGLTAMHTVWIRYHNRLATTLGKLNKHWTDEKIYQETRKIVGALIQHITFREFLPIVVGPEVMELFELNLNRKGFFNGYDERVNPAIANSFGTAAFRFGHSLVQNSYVRFDGGHRPLFNNVSLHQEQENPENIWSFGSVDRLLLGFVNQPTQRRDEFMCEELTNNLFRGPRSPFGVDLAAINIQRGRDHGLPPYTSWRKPCGLSEVKDWNDLQRVLSFESVSRLKLLYEDVDDIDLFTAGLAEKPVRGGIVGPTFACIIAQQFSNLRRGDRFWYENPGFHSSFTEAQLNQIKRITLSEILCQTMREFETVQPFVFLSADDLRNVRLSCESALLNKLDLAPWTEDIEPLNNYIALSDEHKKQIDDSSKFPDVKDLFDFGDDFRGRRDVLESRGNKRVTAARKPNTPKRRYPQIKPTTKPDLIIPISNVTVHSVHIEKNKGGYNDYDEMPNPQFQYYQPVRYTTKKYYPIRDKNHYTYLFGTVPSTTPLPKIYSTRKSQTPLEVNIKIQYYPPTRSPSKRKQQTVYARPPNSNGYGNGYSNANVHRPSYEESSQTNFRPISQNSYSNGNVVIKRPNRRPTSNLGYSFGGDTFVLQPVQMPNRPYSMEEQNEGSYEEQAESSDNFYHGIPLHEDTGERSPKPQVDVNLYNSDENEDTQYEQHDKPHSVEYNDENNEWLVVNNEEVPHHYLETELDEESKEEVDRLYNTKQQTKKHMNNKRRFSEDNKPGNPYSVAYVEKLGSQNSNDRLDFRSKLVYKRKFHKPLRDDDEDDEDGNISSSDDYPEGRNGDHENDEDTHKEKALYRDGNILLETELFDEVQYEKMRLVDINILRKKDRQFRWKPYNKTEPDLDEFLIMPELQQNIVISEEIPNRMQTERTKS